jgi:hypothetical protein
VRITAELRDVALDPAQGSLLVHQAVVAGRAARPGGERRVRQEAERAEAVVDHLAAARIIGRQTLAGLALAHGYDTAFWSIAGIFAGGAVIGGVLLRRGPLGHKRTPSPASGAITMTQAGANPGRVR